MVLDTCTATWHLCASCFHNNDARLACDYSIYDAGNKIIGDVDVADFTKKLKF